MNTKLAALAVIFVAVGLVGSAYAHKSQVIGDYKVGVGWDTEPPIVNKKNQIEVMITSATKADKASGSMDHMDHDHAASTDTHDHMDKKTPTKPKTTTKTAKTTKPMSFDQTDAKITYVSVDSKSSMKMDSKAKTTTIKKPVAKATTLKTSDSKKSDSKAPDEEKLVGGISGLAKDLQVDITLNGKKTMLTMSEDHDNPGRYVGDYTPTNAGYPTVHIYVKINGKSVEGSFHPEKVEK